MNEREINRNRIRQAVYAAISRKIPVGTPPAVLWNAADAVFDELCRPELLTAVLSVAGSQSGYEPRIAALSEKVKD